MPGCAAEKWRKGVRVFRASYNRRASAAMVCGSSMSQSVAGFSGQRGPSPRRFQSRMQVVMLPRAGLAELADLERKGEAALLVKRGKVLLQHLEQPIAG